MPALCLTAKHRARAQLRGAHTRREAARLPLSAYTAKKIIHADYSRVIRVGNYISVREAGRCHTMPRVLSHWRWGKFAKNLTGCSADNFSPTGFPPPPPPCPATPSRACSGGSSGTPEGGDSYQIDTIARRYYNRVRSLRGELPPTPACLRAQWVWEDYHL